MTRVASWSSASGSRAAQDDKDLAMRHLLRFTALAGVLLVLLVISSSAYLRLRSLGLGCEDWPACYGQRDVVNQVGWPSAVRILHRISAALAGGAVLAIGLIAVSRARHFRVELALTAAMLCLLLGLAWLGRASPGAHIPAVALGNVLGGLLLAALLLWIALGRDPRASRAPRWLATASLCALLLTFVQIGSGVLTSASHSGLICSALPHCSATGFPGTWSIGDFDPWRTATASASIHMAHRFFALASAAAVGVTAFAIRRHAPALALGIAALLVAQLALGAGLVLASLPLPAAMLHNLLAALLLLALVAAHHRSRA